MKLDELDELEREGEAYYNAIDIFAEAEMNIHIPCVW